MFLICLIFQFLWVHNILGSSSFRVDKEIVWIADSGTGNIWLPKLTKKRNKSDKGRKKNSRVKFLENECNAYFHNLRSAFLAKKTTY